MPRIESSAELCNRYNEISAYCHSCSEPIFITNNGKCDLAVMSIEAYEKLIGRVELYSLVSEGLEAIDVGESRPSADALADIRAARKTTPITHV